MNAEKINQNPLKTQKKHLKKRKGTYFLLGISTCLILGLSSYKLFYDVDKISPLNSTQTFSLQSLNQEKEALILALNSETQRANDLQRLLFVQKAAQDNIKVRQLRDTLEEKNQLISELETGHSLLKNEIFNKSLYLNESQRTKEETENALASFMDLAHFQNIIHSEIVSDQQLLSDSKGKELQEIYEKIFAYTELENFLKNRLKYRLNVVYKTLNDLYQEHKLVAENHSKLIDETTIQTLLNQYQFQDRTNFLNVDRERLSAALETTQNELHNNRSALDYERQSQFSLNEEVAKLISKNILVENEMQTIKKDLQVKNKELEKLYEIAFKQESLEDILTHFTLTSSYVEETNKALKDDVTMLTRKNILAEYELNQMKEILKSKDDSALKKELADSTLSLNTSKQRVVALENEVQSKTKMIQDLEFQVHHSNKDELEANAPLLLSQKNQRQELETLLETLQTTEMALQNSQYSAKSLEEKLSSKEKAFNDLIEIQQNYGSLNQVFSQLQVDLLMHDLYIKQKTDIEQQKQENLNLTNSLNKAEAALENTQHILETVQEKLALLDTSLENNSSNEQAYVEELERLEQMLALRIHDVRRLEKLLDETQEKYEKTLLTLEEHRLSADAIQAE